MKSSPSVRHVQPAWSSLLFGITAAFALFLASIIITLSATLCRYTIIIMRRSSEPSLLRQELLQKAPLAAISSVLTFLLTLLGFHLKHKYWP